MLYIGRALGIGYPVSPDRSSTNPLVLIRLSVSDDIKVSEEPV